MDRADRQKQVFTRAKQTLVWGFVSFGLLLITCLFGLERQGTRAIDPSYHDRLCLLRAVQQKSPDARIGLVMGSSRIDMGFMPELLPELRDSQGRPVFFFNYCHYGAGPRMHWLTLRRLLRDGVRPDWLVMEVMPPYLANENNHFFMGIVTGPEMPAVSAYLPSYQIAQYGISRRKELLPRYFHSTVEQHLGLNLGGPRLLGAPRRLPLGGPTDLVDPPTPEQRQERLANQAKFFGRDLSSFNISSRADRVLRDTLNDCRNAEINVTLVVSPEGKAFQKLYRPGSSEVLEEYLRTLQQQTGVRIVNARNWLDEDDFSDSHHPILPGTRKFTRRLHVEVLNGLIGD